MIIHASLKTDIPHYYPQWILNRINEEFIDIKTEKGIERYNFKLNNMEKIFFWSKDPLPLTKKIDILKKMKYEYEIVYEMSLYDKFYEPKIKSKDKIINDFRKASATLGKSHISLCYGPVFITYNSIIEWHIKQFEFLCKSLYQHTKKVYIDFNISDNCMKFNNYNIKNLSRQQQESFLQETQKIATKYNLSIDKKPSITDLKFDEIDLGEQNACPSCCVYCVGFSNRKTTKLKNQLHNEKSSLLIGTVAYDEKINEINLYKDLDTILKNINNFSLFDI